LCWLKSVSNSDAAFLGSSASGGGEVGVAAGVGVRDGSGADDVAVDVEVDVGGGVASVGGDDVQLATANTNPRNVTDRTTIQMMLRLERKIALPWLSLLRIIS
jgi:hypothetical protein